MNHLVLLATILVVDEAPLRQPKQPLLWVPHLVPAAPASQPNQRRHRKYQNHPWYHPAIHRANDTLTLVATSPSLQTEFPTGIVFPQPPSILVAVGKHQPPASLPTRHTARQETGRESPSQYKNQPVVDEREAWPANLLPRFDRLYPLL